MSPRFKIASLVLCATALVLFPWIAHATPEPGPAAETTADNCALDGVILGTAQALQPKDASICNASFCITVSDCYAACPEATSASCVNYVCQYDTGGGGGGGGGTSCNTSLCISASDCYDACPEAETAYCGSDNVCVYP